MNSLFRQVGFLFFFYLVAIEGGSEKNKVKIIVPQKVNHVHHHHNDESKVGREKLNYKRQVKEHRIYEDEDQSREEETEESDEESDASSRDVVYYAIPASELFKTRTGLLVKPVLLYKNELLPLLKHPIDNRHGKLYSRFKQDDIPRRGRYLERPRDNKFFAPDFPRREKFYGKGYRLDY